MSACILVVEDDPDIRYLLSHVMLPQDGYKTLAAPSGQVALTLIDLSPPDLILLDIYLPDMSGFQVLERIVERGIEVPTIVITAASSVEMVVRGLHLGIRDFICKPFDPAQVLRVIRRVLSQASTERKAQDLTEQLNQINRLLNERVNQLNSLYQMGKVITASLDRQKSLNEIVLVASQLTNADSSALFLLKQDRLELVTSQHIAHEQQVLLDNPDPDHMIWQVVRTGQLLNWHARPSTQPLVPMAASFLYVPLKLVEKVIGVLGVYHHSANFSFSTADEQILSGLADYAAIAIENVRLFAQTQRRLKEIEILLEIGRQLAQLSPEKEMFDLIMRGPQMIIPDVNKTIIHLVDPQSDRLVPYASSKAGIFPLANVRGIYLDEGIAGRSLREGKPIRVGDVWQSNDFVVLDPSASFRSMIVVPMRIGGRNLGTITVDSRRVNAFTDEDEQTLMIFASQAAVALNNLQLYQQVQRQYDRLMQLQHNATDLGQMTADVSISHVIARVNEQAAILLAAEKCAILLYQEDRDALVGQLPAFHVPDSIMENYVIPLHNNALVAEYWARQDCLKLNDLHQDHPLVRALGLENLVMQAHIQHSLLAVLRASGKSIGVIQVSNKLDGSRFDEHDVQLLTVFAPYAAIAIENTQLFRQFRALSDIGRAIAARLDLAEVLVQVVDGIEQLVDIESIAIWQIVPDDQLILRSASENRLTAAQPQTWRLGEGIPGHVAQSGLPLITHIPASDSPLQPNTVSSARAVMALPIHIRERIWGVIELHSRISADFTAQDQDLLETVSAFVSIAIENAEMFERQRRQVSVMQILLDASRNMTESATTSLQVLLEQIATDARRLLDADSAMVYLLEPTAPTTWDLSHVVACGLSHPLSSDNPGITSDDLANEVRRKGVLVWEKVSAELRLEVRPEPGLEHQLLIQQEKIQALIGVHLRLPQESLGILYVYFRRPRHPGHNELSWIQIFASHASIAIKNAQLFQDIQRRYTRADRDLAQKNEELRRTINELAHLRLVDQSIISTLDLKEVMVQILDGALQIIGVEYGSIMLFDREAGQIAETFDRGLSRSTNSFQFHSQGLDLLLKRRINQVSDLNTDNLQEWPWRDWYQQYIPEARSALSMPIIEGNAGQVIGFINIGSPTANKFSARDERLLEALASQAAVAIQNAQMVRAIQEAQWRSSQAEKVAAQADIATNMVHRINNAVGAIRVSVQQIQTRLEQNTMTPDYLNKKLQGIHENAERTLDMARKIRQPFQVQPTDTEPIDIEQSVRLALEDMPTTINVQLEFAPYLPRVNATQQLVEVFHNLFKNASEAMNEHGNLIVQAWSSEDGKKAYITVTDTGPGIEPDRYEEIFRLGSSSKTGNLGYGLWWTRTFLHRVGGDIQVKSRPGEGCTFKIVLSVRQTAGV